MEWKKFDDLENNKHKQSIDEKEAGRLFDYVDWFKRQNSIKVKIENHDEIIFIKSKLNESYRNLLNATDADLREALRTANDQLDLDEIYYWARIKREFYEVFLKKNTSVNLNEYFKRTVLDFLKKGASPEMLNRLLEKVQSDITDEIRLLQKDFISYIS